MSPTSSLEPVPTDAAPLSDGAAIGQLVAARWPMPTEPSLLLPNARRYETLPEVVIDEVTGLYWERSADPLRFRTWHEAIDECDRLEVGGFDDWRLPTRIELLSLVSLDHLNPAIDGGAFPDVISDWYWTSTESVLDSSDAWYVYLYFGYPNVDSKSSNFSLRCVREEARHPLPANRYEWDEEVVHDLFTGLSWQRRVTAGTRAQQEAVAYCEQLHLAGNADWRAPTMQELQTLVDEARTTPSIDGTAFPDTPNTAFWTLSGWFENPELRAWYVDFALGTALYGEAAVPLDVRCVR